MKKKLSYRDKLVELAYIYDVKEIKDYEKSRKNLTSGQLELILKKNKIAIPKDFKSNFLRDNIIKPVGKIKSNLIEFKENKIKDKNKAIRKLENFKYDTNRKIGRAFKDVWVQLGKIGLNFLNIIPKLGKVIYEFFGNLFTELFHGIYKQQIEPQKAKKVIITIFSVAIVASIAFSGINYSLGVSRSSENITTRLNASTGFRPPHISDSLCGCAGHRHRQIKLEIKGLAFVGGECGWWRRDASS